MHKHVRFAVLIVVATKNTVVWNVMPYSVAEIYQYIKGTYCLHLQGSIPGTLVIFTRHIITFKTTACNSVKHPENKGVIYNNKYRHRVLHHHVLTQVK